MPITYNAYCRCNWNDLSPERKALCLSRCRELLKLGVIRYCKDEKPIYGWKAINREVYKILGYRVTIRAVEYWAEVIPLPWAVGKNKGQHKGIYASDLAKWLEKRKRV